MPGEGVRTESVMNTGGNRMKRCFGTMLLGIGDGGIPFSAMAQVGISINIGLPPPILFPEPPVVIVLPDTYHVYAVPDIEIDLFFLEWLVVASMARSLVSVRYYDRGGLCIIVFHCFTMM
jgi:hypothetical protein